VSFLKDVDNTFYITKVKMIKGNLKYAKKIETARKRKKGNKGNLFMNETCALVSYNTLPNHIRNVRSLCIFKKKLKEFLFESWSNEQ